MTHRQKLDQFMAEMKQRGVPPSYYAPPLFRLLWALGLQVRPPLFLGLVPLTLMAGVPFALLWGVFMWLIQWQYSRMPVAAAAATAGVTGLLFGLAMAKYVRRKTKQLGLT